MPANAVVNLHYGPYESCGIVEHRQRRLEGLEKMLNKDGHAVQFQQINDWNIVELWVNGEMIFKCDIRELDFGGDGELDRLCRAAVRAVREAF